eukprot:11416442-Ditylum_brightwellii.AAC.1
MKWSCNIISSRPFLWNELAGKSHQVTGYQVYCKVAFKQYHVMPEEEKVRYIINIHHLSDDTKTAWGYRARQFNIHSLSGQFLDLPENIQSISHYEMDAFLKVCLHQDLQGLWRCLTQALLTD